MADTSYDAHLEEYSNILLLEFSKLLKEQCSVDIKLACENKSLKIHKCVLMASSSYFKKHLMNNTQNMLIVFKTKFTVITSLVEFIYNGKTTFSEDDSKDLISAAKLFEIRGLSEINIEGLDELPEFPPPIFITELDSHNTTATNKPNDFNAPNDNVQKQDCPVLRFPIMLNDEEKIKLIPFLKNPIYSEQVHSLYAPIRKRGRPKKNPNLEMLQQVTLKSIQREKNESKRSFEYIESFPFNTDQGLLDKQLTTAIQSISDLQCSSGIDNVEWSKESPEYAINENSTYCPSHYDGYETNAVLSQDDVMDPKDTEKLSSINPYIFDAAEGSYTTFNDNVIFN